MQRLLAIGLSFLVAGLPLCAMEGSCATPTAEDSCCEHTPAPQKQAEHECAQICNGTLSHCTAQSSLKAPQTQFVVEAFIVPTATPRFAAFNLPVTASAPLGDRIGRCDQLVL